MTRTLALLATLSLFATTTSFGQTPTNAAAPATTRPTDMSSNSKLDDASYGIGFNMGRQLSGAPFKLDVERVIAGLRDAHGGKPSAVPEARVRAALDALQAEAAAGEEAKARTGGDANVTAGDAYRAANAKKPGVTTLPDGLQIETLTEGTGPSPKPTDTVKVHYTGTLIDGTKFDSSVDRGEPISFPLTGVIKGWTEGLQHMKVGGKARLVIPPSLGYGPRGTGPIPPNATLVFEVQLLAIEK